ncbi:MAG: asparaginase [Bacteroidia bacterium]|nr:asparaginase [Bacteroidia bacterium]
MENPIVVQIFRGGVLESFHRGSICVVNSQDEIVFQLGNPQQICYPRSALKLVQALPLVDLGGIEHFGFSDEEIAVMCGSHNAEEKHIQAVESIFRKIGLSTDYLACGAQYPTHKASHENLIKLGEKPKQIHNNCSGKHAGMLALCKLLNFPVEDYLHPNHPIQKLIVEYIAEFYQYPASKMVCALDGCSAPIYSIPVYNQAIAFKNLVEPSKFSVSKQKACKRLIEIVGSNPFMIAGSNRYCTEMMNISAPKVIGKTGAEGVFCMSFVEQKFGVCIKIDDGKMLPQYQVAQGLLEASGLFSKEELAPIHSYAEKEIRNFNKLVCGETRVNTELFKPFSKLF